MTVSCFSKSVLMSLLLVAGFQAMAEGEHEVVGKLSVLASHNDAIETASMSRIEGDDAFDLSGTAQVSYEYIGDDFGFFTHVQATTEGDSVHGKFGVVELYGYYAYAMSDVQTLTFSAGQFFMPTSMENTDDFWDSPYTNNYSALNTWIAQEVRPIGLEIRFDDVPEASNKTAWGAGVMAFISNDSMGAMLTWRGWSIGRHKSVYGEILNLPEIYHLQQGIFEPQRDDGTKPFGRDLDHNVGYLGHAYWSPNTDFTLKLAYLDSQGDGHLYRGEYAWANYFSMLGIKWRINEQWTLLGETMFGRTAMGYPKSKGTAVDFDTTYVLVSYKRQQWDYTMRLEKFDAVDKAFMPRESNDSGKALTLSAKWQAFGKPWSIIGEWLYIDVDDQRFRALDNGTFIDEDESQLSISLNYSF